LRYLSILNLKKIILDTPQLTALKPVRYTIQPVEIILYDERKTWGGSRDCRPRQSSGTAHWL